jgi:hypothetical protein
MYRKNYSGLYLFHEWVRPALSRQAVNMVFIHFVPLTAGLGPDSPKRLQPQPFLPNGPVLANAGVFPYPRPY